MSEAPQPPPAGQPPDAPGGSRNLWVYLGVGTGFIILAVVLFLVLRPDDSEPAANTTSEAQTTTVQTTTEVTTEQTTTVATTTVQTTTTSPADQVQRVTVDFENGEVVGGLVEATISQGDRVQLVVRADVEDEVHLHGYDLSADVAPNQPARISFRADTAGEFEVELEERRIPLAELTVQP